MEFKPVDEQPLGLHSLCCTRAKGVSGDLFVRERVQVCLNLHF